MKNTTEDEMRRIKKEMLKPPNLNKRHTEEERKELNTLKKRLDEKIISPNKPKQRKPADKNKRAGRVTTYHIDDIK